MMRLATYSIAAFIVVLLLSSSADGGMIYASHFEESRFADTSRAERIPNLEENIWTLTWETKNIELPLADPVPLIHREPIMQLSFAELEEPTPLSTPDDWNLTDHSPADFHSILAGPNVNSADHLSWQPLDLPLDTPPHDFQSIGTNVTADNPACSLANGVLNHDGIWIEPFSGAPCNDFHYDVRYPSGVAVAQLSNRATPFTSSLPWEEDSPNRVPVDYLPQDAILAPCGSEIVSRTLQSNDAVPKSNTGNQQRGWPRLDPS